jgi:sugar lactone lactonase YvrE
MKSIQLAALPLLAMMSYSLVAQTRPITSSSNKDIGRYRLVPADVPDEKTVFLLDTVTGRVWKYQPSYKGADAQGKPVSFPPDFFPVENNDKILPARAPIADPPKD